MKPAASQRTATSRTAAGLFVIVDAAAEMANSKVDDDGGESRARHGDARADVFRAHCGLVAFMKSLLSSAYVSLCLCEIGEYG